MIKTDFDYPHSDAYTFNLHIQWLKEAGYTIEKCVTHTPVLFGYIKGKHGLVSMIVHGYTLTDFHRVTSIKEGFRELFGNDRRCSIHELECMYPHESMINRDGTI